MDELEELQETIFREIQRTEKAMHDTNLRACRVKLGFE
jgi:hypothetical protein